MIGNECGNVCGEQDEGWGSDKARRRCERQGAAAEISSGDFSERANATHKGVLLACAWHAVLGCELIMHTMNLIIVRDEWEGHVEELLVNTNS